jgi:Cyclin, N-terminal domain/Cyclin, C-terminal domain
MYSHDDCGIVPPELASHELTGIMSNRNTRIHYATDELKAMLRLEKIRYSTNYDYLSLNQEDKFANLERVSEEWRRRICEWSFEVVDHFSLDREVVSIALSYLDRVVALKTQLAGEAMHRREFQLIAVTSLYLAVKLHGESDSFHGPRRKLKILAFVELSRGLFTVDTLEAKELEILNLLEWRVNPPTTVRFLATLLRLMPEFSSLESVQHTRIVNAVYEMARYLTELAVCVSSFSFNYKSSEIAYACILCAIEALQSKVQIPYSARIELLNNIANATQLSPHSVTAIRHLLIDLCPAMFATTNVTSTILQRQDSISGCDCQENDGKISPVCVIEQCLKDDSPRKRGRHHSS